jgi:hypothetical protein
LREGTPRKSRVGVGEVDGASISASFFHRWTGRPTPLSCSFAASSGSSGQGPGNSVPTGEEGGLGCQRLGRRLLERPRRPRARREASQLPAGPGVECTAASAGGKVPLGCGSPALRGGGFVPWSFGLQCATQESRNPEPWQLASSGLHSARMRGGARLAMGGGGVVLVLPPGALNLLVTGGAPSLELLGNRSTL